MVNNISVEMNQLTEATGKAKESGTGFFSNMLSSAGGFIAANVVGAITTQVSDFVGSIGKVTMEEQDQMAQLQASLTSTGGAAGVTMAQLTNLAKAQADQTKFSVAQTEAIEKVGLTFTSINKDIFPDTVRLAEDMSAKLGIQGSAAMTMLGKASDDPIKGMTALHKTGTSFTEQQVEQIKALTASGDKLGAYQIILHEVANEYGGSATAAAKTFSGQQEVLAHQMDEVKVKIGSAVLPILGQLTGMISSNVVPVLSTFADWFAAKLPIAMGYVSTTIVPQLIAAWNMLQPAFAMVGTFIMGTLLPTIMQLVGTFQSTVPGAISVLTTYWNTTLLPIFGALVSLWTSSLQPALTALFGWFQDRLPGAIATLSTFWTTTLQPAIAMVAQFIAANVIPLIGTLVTWLKDNLPIAIQTVADFWTNTLQPAIIVVATYIHDTVIPALVNVYTWLKTNIPPALVALAGFWTNTLQPALNAVWSFITTNVIPIFVTLVKDNIIVMQAAVRLLGEVWTNVLQPALTAVWSYINANVMPIFKTIGDYIDKTFSPIVKAISDMLSTQLTKAFGSAKDSMGPVQTAINAVGDAIKGAIDWVQKFIDKLDSVHVPSILTQHSPSILEKALLDVGAAAQIAGGGIEHVNGALGSAKLSSFGGGAQISGGSANRGSGGSFGGSAGTVEHTVRVVVDDRKSKILKGAVSATVDDDLKGKGQKALARQLTGG